MLRLCDLNAVCKKSYIPASIIYLYQLNENYLDRRYVVYTYIVYINIKKCLYI